jgi:P pilus assembly chaperone PapD
MKQQISLKIIEPGKDEPVSREVLWWDGIELAPPRPKQGLLSKKWETHQKKEQQRISGDYACWFAFLHFSVSL